MPTVRSFPPKISEKKETETFCQRSRQNEVAQTLTPNEITSHELPTAFIQFRLQSPAIQKESAIRWESV